MGVDHGDRRVGIAVSDGSNTLATPLATLEVKGANDAVAKVIDIAKTRGITQLVVGLPRNMNGTEGERAVITRRFIEKLRTAGLTVREWDERLTTASIERLLISAGTRRDRRREVVDKLAAQQILQGFLDSQAFQVPPTSDPP